MKEVTVLSPGDDRTVIFVDPQLLCANPGGCRDRTNQRDSTFDSFKGAVSFFHIVWGTWPLGKAGKEEMLVSGLQRAQL